MIVKNIDNGVEVWTNDRRNNFLVYSSFENLDKYTRRVLSDVEDFLRSINIDFEANKIKAYLGKIIKHESISRLIGDSHYRVDVPLYLLKNKIEDYVKDGLNLDPDFQRCHVWSLEQRIRYLEFIISGGKTSSILFNCKGFSNGQVNEFVIVDGKQRLTTLLMFLNNEIPVFKKLDICDGLGYFYKDFDHLGLTVSLGINELPTRALVLQWYLEINKGYIAHTKEEIEKVEVLLAKEFESMV